MHLDEHSPRRRDPDPEAKPPAAPPPKKNTWQELDEHGGWTKLT
jgi:hypothetical protein